MSIQKKNFSDLVTFTRASGGTSFRPVGRGTLVNQVLASGDLSSSSWTAQKSAGATVGALTTGPDGQQSARLVTYATVDEYLYQGFPAYPTVTGQAVTIAFVCSTAARAGGFGGASPSGTDVFAAHSLGGGWWLQTLSRTFTVTTSALTVQVLTGSFWGVGASTVAYHRAALFSGVVTAQQIIDNGGIPLTFDTASNLLRLDRPGDPIQMLLVPANYPRRDYDPVTGVCKGLLIEEQRTNLITFANDFTAGSWTAGSETVAATVSPSGGLTEWLMTDVATTSYHARYRSNAITSGSTYSTSISAKAGTARYLSLGHNDASAKAATAVFDLQTGLVASSYAIGAGWSVVSTQVSPEGDGWFRCALTFVSGTTASGYLFYGISDVASPVQSGTGTANYTGNGTRNLRIRGAQFEAGAFPTSYIPTTGAAATRAGDIAAVNTLSPWYNATEGTIAVDFSNTNSDAVDRVVFSLQSTSWVNNALHFRSYNSSGVIAGYNGATQEVSMSLGALPVDNKVAVAFAANNFAACRNGGTIASDTVGTVPPVTTLMIGSNGSTSQRNGHIRSIQYIPKRLSDAKLQALTA